MANYRFNLCQIKCHPYFLGKITNEIAGFIAELSTEVRLGGPGMAPQRRRALEVRGGWGPDHELNARLIDRFAAVEFRTGAGRSFIRLQGRIAPTRLAMTSAKKSLRVRSQ